MPAVPNPPKEKPPGKIPPSVVVPPRLEATEEAADHVQDAVQEAADAATGAIATGENIRKTLARSGEGERRVRAQLTGRTEKNGV